MRRALGSGAAAAVLALAGVASAQEGAFIDDGSTDSMRATEDDQVGGPGSLQEAASSGTAYRIGSGGGSRVVPELYTVVRGDTLFDVTGRFYGDPWAWPRVWSYNPEITNPHWIYPLDRVRLLPAGQQQAVVASAHGGARVVRAQHPRTQGVLLREEGYLDPEALHTSGDIVGSEADHMLLSPYDYVYVRFDASGERAVQPGQEWTVYTQVPQDDRNTAETGTLVRIFGTVRIESYNHDEHLARAQIIEELDPIERGFRIAPMARSFDDVPSRPNDRDVEAKIVATLRPRVVLGENQVVFIGVGSADGVQLGNRFFVTQAGDRWRRENEENNVDPGTTVNPPSEPGHYPDVPVAEVRVVDVRPHSCTAFVTASIHEIEVGMRAAMRRGY